MNLFLKKLMILLLSGLILFSISFGLINLAVNNSSFLLKKEINYVVFGHSHSTCAFNDDYLSGGMNLSEPAEGYVYTYFKMKKILEENRQIKYVFIEYTNNQLSYYANSRTWGEYLTVNLPKTFAFMDFRTLSKLFVKNPIDFLRSIPVTFKKNLKFLLVEKDYLAINWNNDRIPEEEIKENINDDDIINKNLASNTGIIKNMYQSADINLWYLAKIAKLCNDNKVKLFFVRSPLFYTEKVINNNSDWLFDAILENEFSDIELLDFKHCSFLEKEDFQDKSHLNLKGSVKFSIFFNKLIEKNIVDIDNKQQFILNSMEVIN